MMKEIDSKRQKLRISTLSIVLLINLICTYCLVVLGSTVRVSGSGTGCPSWPLCYGQATPVYGNTHAIVEQSHRYLASVVTILVIVSLVIVLKLKDKDRKNFLLKIAWFAVITIFIQVVLGAITVVTKNAPWTVAAHLFMAMIFMATMVVYFMASISQSYKWNTPLKPVRLWAYLGVAFTFLIIISGSLIVNAGAEQHCPSLPFCPSGEPGKDILLNMIHRSIVVTTFVVYIILCLVATGQYRGQRWWYVGASLVTSAIVITAIFGAMSAVTKANPVFQDFHLGVASLVWITIVALVTKMHIGDNSSLTSEKDSEKAYSSV